MLVSLTLACMVSHSMGRITRKSTRTESDCLSIYISVRTTKSVIGAVPISRTIGVSSALI